MNGSELLVVIAVVVLSLGLIAVWVNRVSIVAWRAERIAKGAVVLADVLEQTMPQTYGGGPRHAADPPDATVHQLRRDVARHPVRATAAAAVLAALFVAAPLVLLSERDTNAAPPFEPIPPRPTSPDNSSSPPTTTTVTVTVTEPGVVGQVGPAGPQGERGEPGVELVRDGTVPLDPPSNASAEHRVEPAPPPPSSSSSAPPSEEPLNNPRTCPAPVPVPPCVVDPQREG